MIGAGIGDVSEIYLPTDVEDPTRTNLSNVGPCKGRRQGMTRSVVNVERSRSRNCGERLARHRVSDRSNRESPSDLPQVASRGSIGHCEVIAARREVECVVAREDDSTAHGTRVIKRIRIRLRSIDKSNSSPCQCKSSRYFNAFR